MGSHTHLMPWQGRWRRTVGQTAYLWPFQPSRREQWAVTWLLGGPAGRTPKDRWRLPVSQGWNPGQLPFCQRIKAHREPSQTYRKGAWDPHLAMRRVSKNLAVLNPPSNHSIVYKTTMQRLLVHRWNVLLLPYTYASLRTKNTPMTLKLKIK